MPSHENSAFRAPQPSAAERDASARPDLSATVSELLNSNEVRAMPAEQQGKFIIDRVVGAVVAAHQEGQFSGSSQPLNSPKEVLDSVSSSAVRVPNGLDVRIDAITRAGGLRLAALALGGDARTGPWVPHLSGQLRHDQYGGPLLTTPAQAEGYVLGIKPGEYASWKEPLIRETRRAVASHADPEWDSRTPMHYGGPDLQRERRRLHDEIDGARAANVDLHMLSDSVNAMQRIDQHYQEKGKPNPEAQTPEAPIVALPIQTYDHLFR